MTGPPMSRELRRTLLRLPFAMHVRSRDDHAEERSDEQTDVPRRSIAHNGSKKANKLASLKDVVLLSVDMADQIRQNIIEPFTVKYNGYDA
ncbi:hypothetical protein LTR53_005044 [Teratosphaeriaceae sp. CCFEE 6253]|nr:hypothetical protein LTR53_005044 [Teratosphaeriaceae sp. CCFEE 6253]